MYFKYHFSRTSSETATLWQNSPRKLRIALEIDKKRTISFRDGFKSVDVIKTSFRHREAKDSQIRTSIDRDFCSAVRDG